MRKTNSNSAGSVLIWVVLVITIMSLVATELLRVVSSKYHSTLHTAVWQESLVAAESGIDLAVIELRKTLYPEPNGAWDPSRGWDPNGVGGANHGLTIIPNAGLAGTPMTINVAVDAPQNLIDRAYQGNSGQYYRIRTIGTMPITGPARAADNKQDTRLRKLSLRWDRFTAGNLTSQLVDSPRVSRRVEAIVKPVSAFDQAIMSVGLLTLTTEGIVIDSYDSRDPRKSRNGLYPFEDRNADDNSLKRQLHGNIATDGAVLNAGGATVRGDVSTNAGVASGIQNITGIERTDFYQDPIPVGAPTWTTSINPMPMVIRSATNLVASRVEGSSVSRFVVSEITLSGGHDTLTLSPDPTAGPSDPSYVEIYVTGEVAVTGQGQITVSPGVKAKIYFAGNFKIAGNGVANEDQKPGNLLFFGINPPNATTVRTLELAGNAFLSAAVYAPAFDVQINNAGNNGSAYGSFVGKTVKMNGVTDLHYDESLGAGGLVNNYKIVSWFEDTR